MSYGPFGTGSNFQ